MINDKECMKNRAVKDCSECCRYNDCLHNVHTLFANDNGCIELGYDIVIANVNFFKTSWKRGYKSTIAYLTKYFKSQTPAIITGEQVNGVFVLEGLIKTCQEEYGSLDHCHEELEKRVKKKIADLERKRSETLSRKRKFELTNKINEVKGELNF